MEASLSLPNRFAMILDTEAIRGVVAHAEQLKLSRRECHPLDRCRGGRSNATLAKYDAEVDAAPAADEELDVIEAVLDVEVASVCADEELAEDDF